MAASRLVSLMVHDARLQWRYGIYGAYAVVIVMYILAIVRAGQFLPSWVPGLIVFSDPAALGFFFLGALMMLEESEGVRSALAVAPLSSGDYFISKAVTLTGMALFAVAIIVPFLHARADPLLLMIAVALTSVQYVAIGVPIALRFKTVNGYLVGSAAFLAPVVAPGFLALLDPTPAWSLVIPAVAQFKLILVATGSAPATATDVVLMLSIATLAAAATVWLALASLDKEFGKR